MANTNNSDTIVKIMENKEHFFVSPSSSNIWLKCTPSAAMMALMPEDDTQWTTEGTDAHALAEWKIRTDLLEEDLPDIRESLPAYDANMEKYTERYLEEARKIVEKIEDAGYMPDIFTEVPLDLSFMCKGGKGTSDLVITAGNEIYVIDFKYGQNKMVTCEKNSQLMIYALGAQNALRSTYGDFDRFNLMIFQPRMGNISYWTIETDDLNEWKEEVLIPRAALAVEGEGETVCGDHCEFCSARIVCKKRIGEKAAALAKLKDKKDNMDINKVKQNMLSVDEVADIVKMSSGIPYWLDKINKFALQEALDGQEYPGLKLIAEPGRTHLDESAVPKLEAIGIDPWKPKELKSKSAMEKELGTKMFNASVKPYLVTDDDKPKLVPDSAKGEPKDWRYFSHDDDAPAF